MVAIHHKIARSRGGTDDEWNLVEMTDYEHAYEHALDFVLFEKAPNFDFRHKGWSLLPKDLKAAVKAEHSRRTSKLMKGKVVSEETRQKIGEAKKGNQYTLGLVHTEESRQKMSIAHTGKTLSEETRRKMSEAHVGKRLSQEHSKRIGEGNRGKRRKVIECPHCGKRGGSSGMKRWHFDNCKQISRPKH